MSLSVTDGRVLRGVERREHRRALILNAAVLEFCHKGYHQTHVSDIIRKAGVARGTFYLYFPSKSAIFLELLDTLLSEFTSNVVGVDTSKDAPPVYLQLVDTVTRILRTAADNAALASIIFREAVGLDEEVERKLTDFYDNLYNFIYRSLENGQKMGLLRPLDTEITATCVLGSIRQVLYREFVEKDGLSFDVDRVARAVLDYNCVGLLQVRK
jgi:AcrR family transcriptional regulator